MVRAGRQQGTCCSRTPAGVAQQGAKRAHLMPGDVACGQQADAGAGVVQQVGQRVGVGGARSQRGEDHGGGQHCRQARAWAGKVRQLVGGCCEAGSGEVAGTRQLWAGLTHRHERQVGVVAQLAGPVLGAEHLQRAAARGRG